MPFYKLKIPEVILYQPDFKRDFHSDLRGVLWESFHQKRFELAVGYEVSWLQENHVVSHKNVLRGLHYQTEPYAQGKLLHVLEGIIFDVAVDLRKDSPTYRKWEGIYLSEKNRKQLWIPEGFAHGFLTISERSQVQYKLTNFYAPEYEKAIRWNDVSLQIKWPLIGAEAPILSEKDRCASCMEPMKTLGDV